MARLDFINAFDDPRRFNSAAFVTPLDAIDGSPLTKAHSASGASWGNHFRALDLVLDVPSTVASVTYLVNYCGGGASPPMIQTSPDGVTWTTQPRTVTPVGSTQYRTATFTNGPVDNVKYIAFADQGFGLHYWCWFQVFDVFADGDPTPTPPEPPPPPPISFFVDGIELENLVEKTIRFELNAAGSGHFVIAKDNPQATAEDLPRGAIVQVKIPQIHSDYLGEFILETGDFDVLSGDEEGGEFLSFGGPGTLAIFRRAVMWHEQFEGANVECFPKKGYWHWTNSAGNRTEGDIIRRIVNEIENPDRPSYPLIPNVTRTFSDDDDTDDVPWGDEELEGDWYSDIGANCYDEIVRLAWAGLIFVEMTPGFVMNAYRNFGRDLSSATFTTGKVRFEKGVSIATELDKSMPGIVFATNASVKKRDGTYTAAAISGTFPHKQEMYFEAKSSNTNTARREAQGRMRLREDAQESIILEVLSPLTGVEPEWTPDAFTGRVRYLPGPEWSDNGQYWLGDIITLHSGDGDFDYDEVDQRVFAITLTEDETGELAVPIVELNAPYKKPGQPGESRTTSRGSTDGSSSGSAGSHVHTGYQAVAEKNQADGYAGLDEDAKLFLDQIASGTPDDGDIIVVQPDGSLAFEAQTAVSTYAGIIVILDGGTSPPATGHFADVSLPFAGTIVRARLLANVSGNAVVDIWKDTYGNFPPTVADSIVAAAKPTLSGAAKYEDTTLTGWTTSFAEGETLRFNLDSILTITRLMVELRVLKS